MTDRTITLTPTEAEKFAALAVGESMWIVRAGGDCPRCWHGANAPHADACSRGALPPVEFVQACAPCDACDDLREVNWCATHDYCVDDCWASRVPCPDCRIELVGPCPNCNGDGWWVDADPDPRTGEPGEPYQVFCQQCGEEGDGAGTVTLGYAYAVGRPALVDIVLEVRGVAFADEDDDTEVVVPLNRLAHYDLATLPGQWAIEVRKA